MTRVTTADHDTLDGPPEPLRLALFGRSVTQPAWVYRAIEQAVTTGVGVISLVVLWDPDGNEPGAGGSTRRRAVRLFEQWDRSTLADAPDPMVPRDLGPLLSGVPVRRVANLAGGTGATPSIPGDGDCDILLAMDALPDPGVPGDAAPLGVWSFRLGRDQGGLAPCLREVLDGDPLVTTALERLTSTGHREVLYQSVGATDRHSVARTQQAVLWKTSEFLSRVLRHLRDRGRTAPPQESGHQAGAGTRGPSAMTLGTGMLRVVGRRVAAKVSAMVAQEQWFLAYHRRKGMPDDNREPHLNPRDFKAVVPPLDRFWADPFPMRCDGADYVLFEDYPYATRRGVISALELGSDGPVGDAVTILDQPHHLSYPFIFRWQGETFLLPETADAHRVEVYRAVRAPFEWSLESVMFEGARLADCTLIELDGRWWMFANMAVPGASFWDELHLFHGPTPFGPWLPHKRNPVVSDVRRSRPAGGLFRRGASLVRPTQDSSRRYGFAIRLEEVRRLTPDTYESVPVGQVLPDWKRGLSGVHTVNALGGLTVIDALRTTRKPFVRPG